MLEKHIHIPSLAGMLKHVAERIRIPTLPYQARVEVLYVPIGTVLGETTIGRESYCTFNVQQSVHMPSFHILETKFLTYLNVILQKYENPLKYYQDTLNIMSRTRHTVLRISLRHAIQHNFWPLYNFNYKELFFRNFNKIWNEINHEIFKMQLQTFQSMFMAFCLWNGTAVAFKIESKIMIF